MRRLGGTETRFTTVQNEGGLIPLDILSKIINYDPSISGLSPDEYHLLTGMKLNEAINNSWTKLKLIWDNFKIKA
jgi:hypothetical protein